MSQGQVDKRGLLRLEPACQRSVWNSTLYLSHRLGNKGLSSPKLEVARGLSHLRIMQKAYEKIHIPKLYPRLMESESLGLGPRIHTPSEPGVH